MRNYSVMENWMDGLMDSWINGKEIKLTVRKINIPNIHQSNNTVVQRFANLRALRG